jgi:molybdopterin-binding protein
MDRSTERSTGDLRLGQAAELLGVSPDTLRRWESEGRLATHRSSGGQRLVALVEVRRLLGERRAAAPPRPAVRGSSARNRFPGIVTRVEREGLVGLVEILAGPHRIVSLMTAEAVEEMDLHEGDEAVAVVKSTNVIVEVPSSREARA